MSSLNRQNYEISTHAPRVGSDPHHSMTLKHIAIFQLTLPVWGATGGAKSFGKAVSAFQLTLPVWGATAPALSGSWSTIFQLTLPVWGATSITPRAHTIVKFQLTLPVWGATAKMRYSVHYTDNIPISPNIRISQSRQTWNTLLFSNFREIKIFDSCSNSTQIQGANIPGEG